MKFETFTSARTGLPLEVNLDLVTTFTPSQDEKTTYIFVAGQEDGLEVKEVWADIVAIITNPIYKQ